METKSLKCGIKFCGGCNSRYDRGLALEKMKEHFKGRVDFVIAQEGTPFDLLLVIGGCTNCCASYEQYETHRGVLKIWDENHLEDMFKAIEEKMKMED